MSLDVGGDNPVETGAREWPLFKKPKKDMQQGEGRVEKEFERPQRTCSVGHCFAWHVRVRISYSI
jgi:hypothetical protein